jgi:beta-lactamase regulating signal transducer with metallopeptidase domain
MARLFEIGLANAAAAALLAAVALAVGRFCRRPAVLHALWLLVLLKLVTPPVLPLPTPGWPTLPAAPAPEVVAAPVAPPTTPVVNPERPRPAKEKLTEAPRQFLLIPLMDEEGVVYGVQVAAADPEPPPEPEPAPAPAVRTEPPPAAPPAPAPAPSVNWRPVLAAAGWVWLAGSAVWFLSVAACVLRFHRQLRHARPAPPELEEQARELAARMGLARCPRLALVPGPVPPMVWMVVGPPRVFLPAELLASLDASERASLLAHELAHLRRRDHWVRWLELAAQGLYWWYPLVWLARRQLQSHEEECCDAWVVGEVPARSYASAILQTLDFLAGAPPVPATASGLSRVAALKRRLVRIMGGGVPKRLTVVGRLALLAVALGVLPLLPTAAPTEAAAPEPVSVEPTPAEPAPSPDRPSRWYMLRAERRFELVAVPRPAEILPTPAALLAVAYSPDGTRLAVASEDHSVEVRDAATGAVVFPIRGHEGPVNCLAFSPDGGTLATGSSDRTVRLWDVADGRELQVLRGHGHWVYAVAFSPDGRTLASGGYDRTVRLWDADTGEELAALTGHRSSVRALAFAPDGKTLASGGGDLTVRLWDVAARRERAVLEGHAGPVRALAFSGDGILLASGSDDGTLRLWGTAAGEWRSTLTGHAAEVTGVAFVPRSRVLVSGGLDRTVRYWSAADGRPLTALPAHADGVTGLAVSPDGRRLASVGRDRALRLWRSTEPLLPTTITARGSNPTTTTFYFAAPKPPGGVGTPSTVYLPGPRAGEPGPR